MWSSEAVVKQKYIEHIFPLHTWVKTCSHVVFLIQMFCFHGKNECFYENKTKSLFVVGNIQSNQSFRHTNLHTEFILKYDGVYDFVAWRLFLWKTGNKHNFQT